MSLQIYKDSYSTIVENVQQQATPSSSLSAIDITNYTAVFYLSDALSNPAIISKSSTSNSQILYTSATAGQMEIYINNTDTKSMNAGPYYYTIYLIDQNNKQYHVITDKIKLLDTVDSI